VTTEVLEGAALRLTADDVHEGLGDVP